MDKVIPFTYTNPERVRVKYIGKYVRNNFVDMSIDIYEMNEVIGTDSVVVGICVEGTTGIIYHKVVIHGANCISNYNNDSFTRIGILPEGENEDSYKLEFVGDPGDFCFLGTNDSYKPETDSVWDSNEYFDIDKINQALAENAN